ncbi:MAG: TldD/PmbA family protein, partial [Candidatus Heimdallarchaeota archaeon]|nr:TldD/PmbA family protein [Candidatus Heimdallarchaeota archaeon]MCK4955921.1 TldD/PmbA family protein [Candidatus Heimdallarchaeota archaeon]
SYGVNTIWEGYAVGTTEGCLSSSLNTVYGANSFFVVTEAGDRKTSFDFVTGRKIQSVKKIAQNALTKAINSLGSKAFGGTEVLPTVWEPREASSFLMFAFFNCLSGTTYVEKSNPWREKLNEQVAVKEFTLIDDGQKPDTSACRAIDAEGIPKQTTTAIENGILKTFLFDKMYGQAAGFASTGNASRGGIFGGVAYENIPSVGPNKMLINEGSKSLDEQISEIDKGILISGEPIGMFTANPVTGDFSITCSEAFLILKGEKTDSLKTISIAGNYFDTLNNIRSLGNDREETGGPLDAPSMTLMNHTISD